MKTTPLTSLQIRNNQLVVGGFFTGQGWDVFGDKMRTNPRFIHNGDFVDPSQPLDIDVESIYQREVTLMYKLETSEQAYSGWAQDRWAPLVPNKHLIDAGLRESVFKALNPELWYPHSRGTVGRKPAFEGQQPVKDVVVIGGGGFRRGDWPVISAATHPGLSRVIGRPINQGLSAQDIVDWTTPIPGRYFDIADKSSPMYRRLKVLAAKHEYRPGKI